MGVDYKKLNASLINLTALRKHEMVHRNVVTEIEDDGWGSQGDSNEIYEVYDIGLDDDMFVKIRLGSDSYGYNETIDGIEFVQMIKKQVTVYEYK